MRLPRFVLTPLPLNCKTTDPLINRLPQVHVVFQHYVISNTERYFPRSSSFLPERWIGSGTLEAPAPRHAFASLPFGYGRRMCLGRRFADLEIQVLLAKVSRSKVAYPIFRRRLHVRRNLGLLQELCRSRGETPLRRYCGACFSGFRLQRPVGKAVGDWKLGREYLCDEKSRDELINCLGLLNSVMKMF